MSRNFCNNTFKNGFTINICTSKSLNSIADVNARLRSIGSGGGACIELHGMERIVIRWVSDWNYISPAAGASSCAVACRVWILFPAHLIEYKKLFKSTLYCDYNYIYYGHGGSFTRKVLSKYKKSSYIEEEVARKMLIATSTAAADLQLSWWSPTADEEAENRAKVLPSDTLSDFVAIFFSSNADGKIINSGRRYILAKESQRLSLLKKL